MSSVIVSHVPSSVTATKLQEFFAFCGSIKSVNALGTEGGFLKYQVNFELQKALSTAILLNDAELDSVAITVVEDSLPAYEPLATAPVVSDNKVQSDSIKTGDGLYDDISQEEKPKAAILAQLLALGYKVSDDLIDRAVKIDNQKGYSTKFKSFLTDLDTKYFHTQDPESHAAKKINKAHDLLSSLSSTFQKLSYLQKLQHYFDKASAHPYGLKVSDFYHLLSKEVTDVHKEAKRLYDLKKKEEAESATPADAAPAVSAPVATEKVEPVEKS